jgi:hypothetical protein
MLKCDSQTAKYRLRQGDHSRATNAVDSVLLESLSDLAMSDLERLRDARNLLFLRRRHHRNDAQKILSGQL